VQRPGSEILPIFKIEFIHRYQYGVCEDEDGQVEVTPEQDWASMRYGCHTPSPASGRDLAKSSTSLARRALKRVQRQQAQRLAATAVIELDEGMVSPSSRPLGKSTSKIKVLPVLEPSVFP
jgi:hypothetical protein